jgi:WD40 repeat protein/Flp pilus assembly protein TadD
MTAQPEIFPEPPEEEPPEAPTMPHRRPLGEPTGAGWPATLAPGEVALPHPGSDGLPPAAGAGLPALPGYEILGLLGLGGMGIVYRARQTALNRTVAVKCLRGTQLTAEELARFRREAEAMAGLAHPNIVPVYDVGSPDGQPFFSMELLPGGCLTQQLVGNPLAADAAARLVLTLAQAVQHAHEHGIVHRDLKPANVLLTSAGVPKIVDFGLARPGGGEDLTQTGAILGTPSYMAPEQARPGHGEVTAQTDVYALGAILYELLTGRPPFKAATPLDTILQVASLEVVPPRRLQPHIPRDLETICLKCLEKEPRKRYASASALAEDVQHFLAGRPIQARPTSLWERAVKWARRRPAVAALGGLSLLVAVLGFALVTWQWLEAAYQRNRAEDASRRARAQAVRAERARKKALQAQAVAVAEKGKAKRAEARARARAEEARRNLATHSVSLANSDLLENNYERAESRLEEIPRKYRRWEWHYLKHLCHADLRTLRGHTKPAWDVVFHPDGRRLASSSWDGTIRLWDLETGRELHRFTGHVGRVYGLAFRPGGKQLASAGYDRTVRIWDVDRLRQLHSWKNPAGSVMAVAYSPNGRHLLVAGMDPFVHVRDVDTGKEMKRLPVKGGSSAAARYSPDGRTIAVGSGNPFAASGPGDVQIFSAATGAALRTWKGHTRPVTNLAFSPDGQRLATASMDRTVRVWEAANGRLLGTLAGHYAYVWGVAFSPDGRRLASCSDDKTVKLWDLTTGQEVWTYRGHYNGIANVKFSPEGWRLASASDDGTVKVWNALWRPEALTLHGHANSVRAVAFPPCAGRRGRLASAGADHTVKIWDARTGREIRTLTSHTDQAVALAYSPDGQTLASASWDKTVKLWDATTGKLLRTLRGHRGAVTCVAFHPGGRELATGSWDKTVKVWNVSTGKVIRTLPQQPHGILSIAYSRTGRTLATSCGGTLKRGIVKLWNSKTGQESVTLPDTPQTVWSLAFSPRAPLLATASGDYDPDVSRGSGQVQLWDARTGKKLRTLRGHTRYVKQVLFSPDGQQLVSHGQDGMVKLWDVARGHEILSFWRIPYGFNQLVFAPDGRRLACAGPDEVVMILDARPRTPAVDRDRQQTVRVQIPLWHRRLARECAKAGNWHGAVFHLNYLIAAAPREADLYAERGTVLGRLARWKEAEADLTKLIRLQPAKRWACAYRGSLFAQQGQWAKAARDYARALERPGRGDSPAPAWVWSEHALVRLRQDVGSFRKPAAGAAGYRRACAALLKHFTGTNDPATANMVARTCAFFPGAVADYGPVLKLSEAAVARYPGSGYYLGVLGGVLYRAGKYQDAVRRLLESGRTRDGSTATEWLFLAMAYHRLKRPEEARSWLGKATQWLAKQRLAEGDAALPWTQKLEWELLRAEAEALVKG